MLRTEASIVSLFQLANEVEDGPLFVALDWSVQAGRE